MEGIKPLVHPLLVGSVLPPEVVRSSWETSLCLPVLWHRADWWIKLLSYFEDQRLLLLECPHCSTLEFVHLNPLIDGCLFCVHMNDMWGLLSDIWVFHKERLPEVQSTKMPVWGCESIVSCFWVNPSQTFLPPLESITFWILSVNKCSDCSKPACLQWAVLLSCVKALEPLQNYSMSLVSPPQTVLQ